MKHTLPHLTSLLLLTGFHPMLSAQTATTNPESWSTLIPSGSCKGCTITIPSGYTLNLNSNGTCIACTFTGSGTLSLTMMLH